MPSARLASVTLPALVLLTALEGCSSRPGGSASGGPAASSVSGGTAASGATGAKAVALPAGVDAAVIRQICTTSCSTHFTQVEVYRDAQEAVRRYLRPSTPGDCTHPPALYFDERGGSTGAIPQKPVVPGSEEARQFQDTMARQIAGLHRAGEVSCAPYKPR